MGINVELEEKFKRLLELNTFPDVLLPLDEYEHLTKDIQAFVNKNNKRVQDIKYHKKFENIKMEEAFEAPGVIKTERSAEYGLNRTEDD